LPGLGLPHGQADSISLRNNEEMIENIQIIDVWMQHPTLAFINHSMFESLRRWTKTEKLTDELPVEFTIAAMDEAKVRKGLLCAWWGPQGPLISNDEVASVVKRYPHELVEYCGKHGREKVLFGTNYPMITPSKCLEGIDEILTDDEVKALFLFRNAQRIFKIT
jgi:hypothetical protein